ncbi:hypothetical protein Phpb_03077 [Photorhabdus namnaonensis]|uniref:Uncharacterized protein n=1 Tax=Photorhabdus namnaonensis TaxID=1851568 RepID=A0A1B8YFM2_9GAMM|nr:hypothetical protein Phpb_03077 [Photorhabdus namnaonensis]
MIALEEYCPFVASDIEETMNYTLFSIMRHNSFLWEMAIYMKY